MRDVTLKFIWPCDWLFVAMTTSSSLVLGLMRGELITSGEGGEPGCSLTAVMLMAKSLLTDVT